MSLLRALTLLSFVGLSLSQCSVEPGCTIYPSGCSNSQQMKICCTQGWTTTCNCCTADLSSTMTNSMPTSSTTPFSRASSTVTFPSVTETAQSASPTVPAIQSSSIPSTPSTAGTPLPPTSTLIPSSSSEVTFQSSLPTSDEPKSTPSGSETTLKVSSTSGTTIALPTSPSTSQTTVVFVSPTSTTVVYTTDGSVSRLIDWLLPLTLVPTLSCIVVLVLLAKHPKLRSLFLAIAKRLRANGTTNAIENTPEELRPDGVSTLNFIVDNRANEDLEDFAMRCHMQEPHDDDLDCHSNISSSNSSMTDYGDIEGSDNHNFIDDDLGCLQNFALYGIPIPHADEVTSDLTCGNEVYLAETSV